jgi:rRNA maturation endonuclease Nob1
MAYRCILAPSQECTGCGECEKTERCPYCGSRDYSTLYKREGQVIGCSDCIDEV